MYKELNRGGRCLLSFQPRLQGLDIQYEYTGTLCATDYKGAKCILMIEPINYAIDSMSSNSMKSSNPNSGIHEENYVRTIDTNGNNPHCNQGGNMIVYVKCLDCYNNALTDEMTTFGTNLGMSTGRSNLFVAKTTKLCESVAGIDFACEYYEREGISPVCKYCVPINEMVATRYKADDGRTTLGIGKDGDPLSSITSSHSHAVCCYNNLHPIRLRVRKITEKEALKLMGLPATWFDGSGLPKTKQYEKCGNGLVTGKGSYWWYMWQNIYKLLNKPRPTLFSQFNGVGMTEYITEEIGFSTVYTSEIDESANKAYAHLQRKGRLDRKTKNLGDITKVSGYEIKPCDVIFSSSPCQSISRAGKQEGEGGASGLIWHTIRTAKEMLEATNGRYPSVIATENVAGELTHKDFLTKLLISLDRMGYAIDIQMHNALDYNVAQSRERVSIVAMKKEFPHDNNFEEHRHNRVKKVLKETNADIELFSGIATFPHEPKVNNLHDFLDDDVDESYDLSEKVCVGILRRSFQRRKEIPAILAYALMVQSGDLYYEKEYDSNKGKVNGDDMRKWYADVLIDKGFEKIELPTCLENRISDARWGTGGNNTGLILDVDSPFSVIGSTQDNAYIGDGKSCCTLNEAMGKGGGHIPIIGVLNDTGGVQHNAEQNRHAPSGKRVRCFGGGGHQQRIEYDNCCPTITQSNNSIKGDTILILEEQHESSRT